MDVCCVPFTRIVPDFDITTFTPGPIAHRTFWTAFPFLFTSFYPDRCCCLRFTLLLLTVNYLPIRSFTDIVVTGLLRFPRTWFVYRTLFVDFTHTRIVYLSLILRSPHCRRLPAIILFCLLYVYGRYHTGLPSLHTTAFVTPLVPGVHIAAVGLVYAAPLDDSRLLPFTLPHRQFPSLPLHYAHALCPHTAVPTFVTGPLPLHTFTPRAHHYLPLPTRFCHLHTHRYVTFYAPARLRWVQYLLLPDSVGILPHTAHRLAAPPHYYAPHTLRLRVLALPALPAVYTCYTATLQFGYVLPRLPTPFPACYTPPPTCGHTTPRCWLRSFVPFIRLDFGFTGYVTCPTFVTFIYTVVVVVTVEPRYVTYLRFAGDCSCCYCCCWVFGDFVGVVPR